MMLTMPVRNAREAMDFLDLVKQHGLIIEQDFSWSFVPSKYDGYNEDTHTQPLVEFMFRDPAIATFFQIKWTQ